MAESAYAKNKEHSISMGIKCDFFYVGLTFSILALAVKTTIDHPYLIPRLAEVIGLISLLVSGLLGLHRLEWKPVALDNMADLVQVKEKLIALDKIKLQGDPKSLLEIDSEINKYKAQEAKISKVFNKQEKSIISKYDWRNRTFYAGIIALMISRSWGHFQYFYDWFQALMPPWS